MKKGEGFKGEEMTHPSHTTLLIMYCKSRITMPRASVVLSQNIIYIYCYFCLFLCV